MVDILNTLKGLLFQEWCIFLEGSEDGILSDSAVKEWQVRLTVVTLKLLSDKKKQRKISSFSILKSHFIKETTIFTDEFTAKKKHDHLMYS